MGEAVGIKNPGKILLVQQPEVGKDRMYSCNIHIHHTQKVKTNSLKRWRATQGDKVDANGATLLPRGPGCGDAMELA